MYKIVELTEKEISNYKGKILQVINTIKQPAETFRTYGITSYMWVLTCLVEE